MIEPVEIVLTWRELAMAADCGCMRNLAAMRQGNRDANGFDEEWGWNAHIEGAAGEVACAKALGRFWSPTVNVFKAPDIGMNIQCRTRSNHDWDLLHRPNDDPANAWVLITGRAPRFFVRGYRLGKDCRNDTWLQDYAGRPAAWFVPQAELWPIADLKYVERQTA